ncbi:hypothetical protein E4U40_003196 [Claviceps sp. LM458 group G5]|nr:hypothetical protein E4U40_003196 [Claviceps sp. LM458 group G5]
MFYEGDGQQEWFMIDRDLGWDLQQDNLLYKILYPNLHRGTSVERLHVMSCCVFSSPSKTPTGSRLRALSVAETLQE